MALKAEKGREGRPAGLPRGGEGGKAVPVPISWETGLRDHQSPVLCRRRMVSSR